MSTILKPFKKILQVYFDSFSGLSKDIWLLSLMTLINRTGTMVIIFMTIYLTEELGWTLTQAGIAMSVFGLGSVGGSFLGGWLTDRIGYYSTMFWSLLMGGASFFLLMQMETFLSYCITVFVVSLINDTFRPANLASINVYAKPENHNRSLSLIRLAINLGFALGVGVAGIITEYFGFKALFIVDGVTCILAAFYFNYFLEEKEEVVGAKEEKPVKKAGESAYLDFTYLFFGLCIFLMAIVFMQLWNTLPVYFTDALDISKDDFGLIMLANGFLLFILEMPIVYIFEKRFQKMDLIIVGVAMIAFSFLIFNLTTFWQLAIFICIVFLSIGEIIAFPFSNAFALERSKPGRRGEYMGVYTMAWSFAMIIGPTLGMRVAELFGYTFLWYLMSGIGIAATLGFFIIKMALANQPLPHTIEGNVDVAKPKDIVDIPQAVKKDC